MIVWCISYSTALIITLIHNQGDGLAWVITLGIKVPASFIELSAPFCFSILFFNLIVFELELSLLFYDRKVIHGCRSVVIGSGSFVCFIAPTAFRCTSPAQEGERETGRECSRAVF